MSRAKGFLSKAFPFISTAATMFGGPIGAAAAATLGRALGKDVKPELVEEEANKLAMTEDGRLKLEQAENDLQLTLGKLGYETTEDLLRLDVEDRDSARSREIAVRDKMPMIMGLSTTLVFFGVMVALLFREVPKTSRDILMILIGVLAGSYKDIVGYFFGSSAGSAAARDTISKIAAKQ